MNQRARLDSDTDPVLGDTNDAVDDRFAIESLPSLYLSLQAEFQMLYIESTNVVPAQIPEVEVTDITPDPIPLPVAVGTGLVGLLLLGIGVILVNDRLRPRWWTQADLAGVVGRGARSPGPRRNPGIGTTHRAHASLQFRRWR